VNGAASRLRSALAAVLVQAEAPELTLVHRWLDSWTGVGLLAAGLHRTGYDLQLTQYGDGHWRASFYVTGAAHSILGGSAWEPSIWRAVQQAGWEALSRSLPGNGLGLAIVTAISHLHGGSLALEDAGPGLIARIVLPRVAPRTLPNGNATETVRKGATA
jgi:hypothetical protein